MIYTTFKGMIRSMVEWHFKDPGMRLRFAYLMDSEIWNPKEDESVFNRKRNRQESCHILFDFAEIIEIPTFVKDKRVLELAFLRNFKSAIERGVINIEVKPQFTDNASARRSKRQLKVKKHQAMIESYQYARSNPMSTEEVIKRVAGKKRKTFKIKN
jgi:hypothetical protein